MPGTSYGSVSMSILCIVTNKSDIRIMFNKITKKTVTQIRVYQRTLKLLQFSGTSTIQCYTNYTFLESRHSKLSFDV